MPIMGVSKFERLFRAAGSLDVDRDDIKRYGDFVNQKLHDLLLIAQATAKANSRDIIQSSDLPITKGLQESIHNFTKLDQEIETQPILAYLATRPPLDLALSEEVQERLPVIAGGLSVALARTFKIIDPHRRNPGAQEWERAFQIFDLLL